MAAARFPSQITLWRYFPLRPGAGLSLQGRVVHPDVGGGRGVRRGPGDPAGHRGTGERKILGYTIVSDEDYYEALRAWCQSRYDWIFPVRS